MALGSGGIATNEDYEDNELRSFRAEFAEFSTHLPVWVLKRAHERGKGGATEARASNAVGDGHTR